MVPENTTTGSRALTVPPGSIESKLVKIWSEVLHQESIELTDNYFSLGGNSLLALTLISRIKKEFRLNLPVSSIVEAPTITEFATLIENQGSLRPLILLRDGGEGVPVFLVHDADGETVLYRNLARRLNPRHPVYGLGPLSKPNHPILHVTLEEMAAYYVKNMRQIQPSGPYVIGGLCAGGIIAYEMTRQLEKEGQSVAVLAIFDAADVSAKEKPMRHAKARLGRLVDSLEKCKNTSKLNRLVKVLKTITWKVYNTTRFYLGWYSNSILTRVRLALFQKHLRQGTQLPKYLQNISVRTVYNNAKRLYKPFTPINQELLLIRATSDSGLVGDDPYIGRYVDPLMGWEKRTRKTVKVFDTPGGHFSMFQEPHVIKMAEFLQGYIDSSIAKPEKSGSLSNNGISTSPSSHPEAVAKTKSRDSHANIIPFLRLAASSLEDLNTSTKQLADHLVTLPEDGFYDYLQTISSRTPDLNWKRVVVAAKPKEFLDRLRKGSGKGVWTNSGSNATRKVAFIIAGVGEHAAGAGKEIYESELVFHEAIDECAKVLNPVIGRDILGEMLTDQKNKGDWFQGGSNGILKETIIAQPAAFVLNWSLSRMWMSWGINPSAVLGYSVGEYVAAALAGVLRMEDALVMLARRAEWIDQMAQPGVMLAVSAGENDILPRLSDRIWLAAVNSPQSTVVGGSDEEIKKLEQGLQEAGVASRRVVSMNGTHTPLLARVKDPLRKLASSLSIQKPSIPMVSNITGTWLTESDTQNPGYWGDHMCGTLRFESGIGELLKDSQNVILEIGPGAGLGAMVRQHNSCEREQMGRIFTSLPPSWEKISENEHIAATLGRLWLEGVTINWNSFYRKNHSMSY